MKKAIVVVPVLAAALALAGWQRSAHAAEKGTDGAAGGGVEATIMKLHEKIKVASLKGDAATIKDLYAADYVGIRATSGAPNTKADLIENVKSGKLKYDSIDISDMKVHVYGPTMALATAKAEVKGRFGEQDLSGTYRGSWLFVKRGGKWQVVFFQSTTVPTQMRTG